MSLSELNWSVALQASADELLLQNYDFAKTRQPASAGEGSMASTPLPRPPAGSNELPLGTTPSAPTEPPQAQTVAPPSDRAGAMHAPKSVKIWHLPLSILRINSMKIRFGVILAVGYADQTYPYLRYLLFTIGLKSIPTHSPPT
eukprot:scaffold9821_cov17-Prasinocladus_malaysianus.AAC.1